MVYNGNYIGGYTKGDINSGLFYDGNNVIKKNIVKNTSQLLAALESLKGPQGIIYLDDNSVFDLSGLENVTLPEGITLLSGRGINGSKGALIYSNALKTNPLFTTGGNGVSLIGLRLQGPDPYIIHPQGIQKFIPRQRLDQVDNEVIKKISAKTKRNLIYGIGNSRAIEVKHLNVTIENCEIYGWSHAGISVKGGSANVKYNYIHSNQRLGLGYGIMIDKGNANVIANIFKDNRHAIAGTGNIGTSYVAEFNILYANKVEQGHQFDMHGGRDRGDNTNIAGEKVDIRSNIVMYEKGPSVLIRGNPQKTSVVEDNLFIRVYNANTVKIDEKILSLDNPPKINRNVIRQTYGKLRLVQKNNRFIDVEN